VKVNTQYFSWTDAAAATNFPLTTPGVSPKFVIAWTKGLATGRFSHRRSIGFAASPSSRFCTASQSVDDVTTSSGDKAQRTDCVLAGISTAGAIDALLDVTVMAPGVTFTVDDAMPAGTAQDVEVFVGGGTEITNVATGVFDQRTSAGDSDITSVGFQPDFVLLLSSFGIAPEPDIRAGTSTGIGACDAALNQWACGTRAIDELGTSDTGSYMKSGQIIAVPTTAAGIGVCIVRASLTSMLSNGFRLNYAEADATVRRFGYLAIKGGKWRVGGLTTKTALSTDIIVSGLGYRPSGILFVSSCRVESTDDVCTADDQLSIGCIGDSGAGYMLSLNGSTKDTDAQAVTAVSVQLTNSATYTNTHDTSGVIEGAMIPTLATNDGFINQMSVADTAQNFVGYIACGDPPTGVVGGGLIVPENQ
jgi:hypothetical protein